MRGFPRVARTMFLLAALAMGLSACGSLIDRPEVRQGVVLTQEAIQGLEIGLSRAQIRERLGAPLLHDSFHSERWDYVYYRTEGGTPVDDPQRLTLFFEDDRLVRIVDHYEPPAARPEDTKADNPS